MITLAQRFTDQPGIVLLSKAFVPANATEDKRRNTLSDYLSAKEILENATDAQGRQLKTVTGPSNIPSILSNSLADRQLSPRTRSSQSFRVRLLSTIRAIDGLCKLSRREWRCNNVQVWGRGSRYRSSEDHRRTLPGPESGSAVYAPDCDSRRWIPLLYAAILPVKYFSVRTSPEYWRDF